MPRPQRDAGTELERLLEPICSWDEMDGMNGMGLTSGALNDTSGSETCFCTNIP